MFSTVRLGWQGGSGCGSGWQWMGGIGMEQWQWQWGRVCHRQWQGVTSAVDGWQDVSSAVSRVFLCVSVSRVCLQQVTAGPPRHIDRKCGHINSTDQQLHTATQPDQQPRSHLSSHPLPPSHSHCHPQPHCHSHCHARKALVQHQRPVLHPPPIPHNSPRELNLPLPPPVLLVGVVVQAVLGARGAAAGGVLRVGGRG
jgi:hypothetical protein